jgi:hypothetical protein
MSLNKTAFISTPKDGISIFLMWMNCAFMMAIMEVIAIRDTIPRPVLNPSILKIKRIGSDTRTVKKSIKLIANQHAATV